MTESGLSDFARSLIDKLELEPHPEGGWYRRTWQSPIAANGDAGEGADMGENSCGPRPLASLIYFLLPAGDASAWHLVDSDEVWLWHGPGSVTLEVAPGSDTAPDTSHAVRTTLAVTTDAASCAQLVVPAGSWQRTIPSTEDALVSCVVSPGFVYSGFTLAQE